eukprot:gene26053-biopygen17921
MSRGGCSQP